MSLADARKHWRLLATLLLVCLALAAAGPIIFYGVGPLFSMIVSGSGFTRWLLFAILIGAAPAWFFFALWAGRKADQSTLASVPGDRSDHSNG